MTGLGAVKGSSHCPFDDRALTVQQAVEENKTEVLAWLSQRPTHTFGMVGMILSNGLINPLNRGTFYICRNEQNKLEGVALIGYNNLFEAHSEAAISAIANLFQTNGKAYLLMGEETNIAAFIAYYNHYPPLTVESSRYALYKQHWPIEVHEPVKHLRPANLDDLDLVIQAHKQSGIEETGVDGFQQDPTGFTKRCVNRIEKKHTWVWIENNQLIFKVEIITSTPAMTYLESLWVDSDERHKGYGRRCLAQLGRLMLQNSSSICLLVNETNLSACSFYEKAGYKKLCHYRVLFFNQQTSL